MIRCAAAPGGYMGTDTPLPSEGRAPALEDFVFSCSLCSVLEDFVFSCSLCSHLEDFVSWHIKDVPAQEISDLLCPGLPSVEGHLLHQDLCSLFPGTIPISGDDRRESRRRSLRCASVSELEKPKVSSSRGVSPLVERWEKAVGPHLLSGKGERHRVNGPPSAFPTLSQCAGSGGSAPGASVWEGTLTSRPHRTIFIVYA